MKEQTRLRSLLEWKSKPFSHSNVLSKWISRHVGSNDLPAMFSRSNGRANPSRMEEQTRLRAQVVPLDNVGKCRKILPPELPEAYDPAKARANAPGTKVCCPLSRPSSCVQTSGMVAGTSHSIL